MRRDVRLHAASQRSGRVRAKDTRMKSQSTMQLKSIAFINAWFPERCYGFLIEQRDGEEEPLRHFLHIDNVVSGKKGITKGMVVRFDAVMRKKGSSAVNAEVFANRQEMELHDAMLSLVSAVPTGAEAVTRG